MARGGPAALWSWQLLWAKGAHLGEGVLQVVLKGKHEGLLGLRPAGWQPRWQEGGQCAAAGLRRQQAEHLSACSSAAEGAAALAPLRALAAAGGALPRSRQHTSACTWCIAFRPAFVLRPSHGSAPHQARPGSLASAGTHAALRSTRLRCSAPVPMLPSARPGPSAVPACAVSPAWRLQPLQLSRSVPYQSAPLLCLHCSCLLPPGGVPRRVTAGPRVNSLHRSSLHKL